MNRGDAGSSPVGGTNLANESLKIKPRHGIPVSGRGVEEMDANEDIAAFKGGDCVAIASSPTEHDDDRITSEWLAKGYTVRLLSRPAACDAHRAYLSKLPAFRGL